MTDEVRTERLLLRQWRDSDLDPWVEMNADPLVREFLGGVQTSAHSAASIDHFRTGIETRGWGFWAVEVTGTGEFVGFAGFDEVDEDMPFHGIEIGWRLARRAWGHGYATEAARACVDYGFGRLGLHEILAVAAKGNIRSHAVMRRLGMTHNPAEDFEDPTEPPGSPQRAAVLYRLKNPHLAR